VAHHHTHEPANYNRAFFIGITLNTAYVVLQVVSGVRAHSLALISDAVHNCGDVLGLALAWGASALARRPPTPGRTYGWRRSTILSALVNAIFLIGTMGAIAWESLHRLRAPATVAGGTVLVVSLIGIVVNGVSALFFLSGRKRDLNIRGAFLHLASDAALTFGIAVTGALILLTGWDVLDPIVSLILVAVILYETWGLLRESLNLALDAVPEGIDMGAVRAYLSGLPGVTDVHDVHVWAMSTTEVALTAHLVIPTVTDHDALLARACAELHDRFGIEHPTLQIEVGDPAHPCPRATVGAI
jgi:cobalt-zinc-cadmium efflux system protein